MIDPRDLYVLRESVAQVPAGLHLLAGLSGFSDSGSTISQVSENIFANFETQLVVEFSNDQLLDYRSRRPVMYFEKDHIISYDPPTLGIYLVRDDAGTPFLFLHGYEPDFKWDAFVAALSQVFELFDVKDVTWVHSIPFPVPHTRPVGVTVSGNRQDLIETVSEWKPSTQVPGNVLHVLEYRLTPTGLPIAGFVFLVPHYLSDSDYPQAAIAAFERIASATGLVFKTDPLRDEAERFNRKIRGQMEENADLARVVSSLEQGYLANDNTPGRAPITKPEAKVPSADEIAAELEDFLAARNQKDATDDSED
jgi:predicted ATP-grasp superfamily ATP-dependent carboligase